MKARAFCIPRLNDHAMSEIEQSFLNDKEAHELLALIDAEFRSDPMSVQCFDLGIVDRVRVCVELHKREKSKWFGDQS